MTVKLKCLSHTPLRGLNDPGADVVAEVDAALAKARAEVEAFDPELIVIFAPDHYNGLFYDLMPPFVIATAAESVGDYLTQPGPLSVERTWPSSWLVTCSTATSISPCRTACRWTMAAPRPWKS